MAGLVKVFFVSTTKKYIPTILNARARKQYMRHVLVIDSHNLKLTKSISIDANLGDWKFSLAKNWTVPL